MSYNTLLFLWVAAAVVAFFALLKIPAPYGRHRSGCWGPTIPAPAGWFAMEFPSPVVLTYFVATGNHRASGVTWLFVALWWVHYLNRSVVYPLRMRGSTTRIPISVVVMGIAFHVFNGYLVGSYFSRAGSLYVPDWLLSPAFLIGGCLFITGFWINDHADRALLRQRQEAQGRYIVPRGGLFEYVSAPNYLGEIIEWFGFAVMTWNPAALAFALWTFANLAPRALAHHRWYHATFADYPEERKALVPLVL